MKKQSISLLFFFFFAEILFAQKNLTYVSDRKFKDVSDLLGFNFRPAEKEIKGGSSDPIQPGSVTFGITRSNLFVEGEGIAGVYNINNINPAEYGFKLLLLDARNPAEQGHLKVILNGKKECAAVVFKKGTKSPEIIFHIAELPENLARIESQFFTDRGEMLIENKDSLWGKTIRPFHRLHQNVGIQERLIMADSMRLHFFETIEVIDKNKKKKLQKADNQAVTMDSVTILAADSVISDPKKIKINKRHFVRVTGNYKFEDGSQQLKTEVFEIKNYSFREDKNAINPDDHFLLELELDKHTPIQIFLNEKQTVSYLEIDSYNYLMRGF
jgi:hypothetical protein